MNFGATPIDPTTTRFRFWAPALQSVAHEVERLEPVPMRRLDDKWFEAETLCGAGAACRFAPPKIWLLLIPPPVRWLGRVFGDGVVSDPGCASYRRTCDRPGCDSRPRETRRGKTPNDRRQSERTGGSLVCARCPRGSALSRGRLFVRVRRGRLKSRRIAARRGAWWRLCRPGAISAEEALRRFGGLRLARSARRSRPSPRPLHRARPQGRRSRPPGLPPSGSGSLSTCP